MFKKLLLTLITISGISLLIPASAQTNILNPAAVTDPGLIYFADGTVTTAYAGYYATDYMVVSPGVTYTANGTTTTGVPETGWAFYDSNKVYISGSHSSPSATAPANAAFARVGLHTSEVAASAAMIVSGTTVPSSYVPYSNPAANFANLLNPAAVTDPGLIYYTDGTLTFAYPGYYATDYMVASPGVTYTANGITTTGVSTTGWAFYNSAKVYISGSHTTPNSGVTPAGTAFMRVGLQTSNVAASAAMVGVAPLPSSYVAYAGPPATVTVTGLTPGSTLAYTSPPIQLTTTTNGGAVTYSATGVATVSSSGLVSLTRLNGSFTVTATAAANGSYSTASASITANVSGAPVPVVGFVNITHANIVDATGQPLAKGTECFTPVTNSNIPISVKYLGAGGSTGTISKATVCYAITNGTLQSGVHLPDSTLTIPRNLCIRMTITNRVNGQTLVGSNDGYSCIQPSGNTLELSTVTPNLPGIAMVVAGAAGQAGPQGIPGVSGAAANSRWFGKRYCSVGDSITYYGRVGGAYTGYQQQVASKLGMTLAIDNGVSGEYMTHVLNIAAFTSVINSSTITGCDLLTVFLGTNDFGNVAMPIGSITDAPNTTGGATFYAAMDAIIKNFLTWNPNLKLIFITPIQRYAGPVPAGGGFLPQTTPNSLGFVLSDYVTAILNKTAQYGIEVVDLYHRSGINPVNAPTLLFDQQLHPNQLGYDNNLAPLIISTINRN